eukprot:s2959_g2.t4
MADSLELEERMTSGEPESSRDTVESPRTGISDAHLETMLCTSIRSRKKTAFITKMEDAQKISKSQPGRHSEIRS